MSTFDPDEFMNATVEGVNSTSRPPMPEHEALGVIKSVDVRTPKSSVILDVTWIVDSDEARSATGMDEPTCRQSIFLDINDAGQLDMSSGSNIQLGRLREALGQNTDGGWSPSQMVGATARIKIGQRPNKDDSSIIYNDVTSVTAA